ncbi:MAG: hypothetical protein FWD23_16645 [Oscillospiraceae bacterium]|nr:hypothetical protein [Oscillospiraceae bacterium]
MATREITYHDVSPYAAKSANAAANQDKIQDFSELQKLFWENQLFRSIQTCEQNYTILDGAHKEFRKNENIAIWSKMQSLHSSRLLPESVTLDITFGGLQSSPGIAFYFDTRNHVWCDMLRVKWYNNNSMLSDEMFYPDSAVYSCNNKVELYNRVTIELMRLNMPHRYLRIEAILFGIVRVFGDGDLENLTLNEGFDPTGRTLYINSANFTINTKDPAPYIFMKRQPLYVRYNGIYMGTYYIDKSKRYADRRYSVEAVDKIAVLDAVDGFMGSVYNNVTAESLINEIAGGIFDVDIDENLKNINISGWLPIMSRREALAQVAVAIGAMIDTSRTNVISVKPIPEPGVISSIIGKDRVYQAATVDIEFPCTGIELTEHNYAIGTAVKELFKDTFTGERTVKFSKPVSNLTIENGTILSSGANHAVITSSGIPCILSGRPYIDSQSLLAIKSGDMIEGTQERIEKIDNCYLVNKNNSQTVAQRLYEYYLRQNLFDGDFLIDSEKIGDIVKIATVFEEDGNYISGQIEKLTLRLGSKNIKARGIIRGD